MQTNGERLPTGPAALLDRLRPAIDPRSGIIAGVEPLQLQGADAWLLHGFSASLGAIAALRDEAVAEIGSGPVCGYGTARSATVAEVRAVCESLERYCAMMPPPPDDRLLATANELGSAALDIFSLPRCSAAERMAAPSGCLLAEPSGEDVVDWIEGYSLTRSRVVRVPTTCVYLGLPHPLCEHLAFPVSTGFAAGEDVPAALRSGLCEVLERDALALWWIARTRFPRLEAESLDAPGVDGGASLVELLLELRRTGVESTLFDLTGAEGVPIVGLVQRCEQSFPHVVTMAACRASAAEAALRVVEEAASLRAALCANRRANDDFADVFESQAVAAERFGLLHAERSALPRFGALIDASPRASLPTPERDSATLVDEVVARFAAAGRDLVAVDVTLPEVRELGIVVVRVIVPSLVPLSFAHAVRHLDHPRLKAALARTGNMPEILPIPYA